MVLCKPEANLKTRIKLLFNLFAILIALVLSSVQASANSFNDEIRSNCIELDSESSTYVYSNFHGIKYGPYLIFKFLKVLDEDERKEVKSMLNSLKDPKVIVQTAYVKNVKSNPIVAVKDMYIYGQSMSDLIDSATLDAQDLEWTTIRDCPDLCYDFIFEIDDVIKSK